VAAQTAPGIGTPPATLATKATATRETRASSPATATVTRIRPGVRESVAPTGPLAVSDASLRVRPGGESDVYRLLCILQIKTIESDTGRETVTGIRL
jgi:hypothetical protein